MYGDKVRIVWKHNPLPFHPNAMPAALASMAAHEQGKFWEYHDKVFANQQKMARPDLLRHAQELGLDVKRFEQALNAARAKPAIDADAAEARSLGATGTPAFFINGRYLSGAKPFEEFAQVFVSRGDVIWGPEEYVQPDLFVVPRGEVTGNWRDCQHLLLAVEVISPSSARGDRFKKRSLYQRRGVGTYWIVDADAQLVEVWHPQDERPEIVTDVLGWRVTPDAPELRIDLPQLFANLPG